MLAGLRSRRRNAALSSVAGRFHFFGGAGAGIYHTCPPAAWDLNPSDASPIGTYNM